MQEILNPAGVIAALPFVIVGINQLLKTIGFNSRYSPIVNLILGFIAFPVLSEVGFSWFYSSFGCLIIGLSAGGFYDLGKTTILNK